MSTATQVALDAKANDPITVKSVSDQTIAGVKTFSNPPLVPDAGGPNQAINKSQMDTADNLKVNKYGDIMTNSLLERYTGDVILGLQSTTAATGKRYNRISAGVGNFGIHNVTSAKIPFRIMTDAPNLALYIRSDRININGIGTITGTGFPNGVVTAPDGFTYLDRSATSGITCWSKRVGTSNTG